VRGSGLEQPLQNQQKSHPGQAKNTHDNGVKPGDSQGYADKLAQEIQDEEHEKAADGVHQEAEQKADGLAKDGNTQKGDHSGDH